MKYYPAIKKGENPAIEITLIDLEGIRLSGISQTVKDKHHMFSSMCGI